ncbi:AAA-domain-containing protein [Patellaria atrata CBS 101060]|uniref:AAA-domain-containing protein n=1 Tax=Patellaria atrata CBS 101060 TaxID=1346257 RepID=A0A9P4S122_9PEZI|nr:AAA-domain-containing protein [Patellaria atrata CBS 101060]
MHTAIRGAKWSAIRYSAKFRADRRYAQETRQFHWTLKRLEGKPNLPSDTPISDSQDTEQDGSQKSGADMVTASTTEGGAKKVGTQTLVSPWRRSSRYKRVKEINPFQIPDWFLEQNVKLREGLTSFPGLERPYILSLEIKDAQTNESLLRIPIHHGKGGMVNYLHELDVQRRRSEAFAEAKFIRPVFNDAEQPDSLRVAQFGPEEQIHHKLSGFQKNKFLTILGDDLRRVLSEADQERDTPYYKDNTWCRHGDIRDIPEIDPRLYGEIEATIVGSLLSGSSATTGEYHSFPHSKANLLLQSAQDGSISLIDSLITQIASKHGADIIELDSQHIAELAGDYLGDGLKPERQSIRNFSYDVYESEEELNAEEDDDAPQPWLGLTDLVESMKRNGIPGFINGSRIGTAHEPGSNTLHKGPSIQQRSIAIDWDSRKLSTLLDTLLDAHILKRSQLEESRRCKAQPPLYPDVDVNEQGSPLAELHLKAFTEGSADNSSKGRYLSLRVDKAAPRSSAHSTTADRTIILLKDMMELIASPHGSIIVDKLADAVAEKRRAGHNIMIIGTTASSTLMPELSVDCIDEIQAQDDENSLFRTIFVFFGRSVPQVKDFLPKLGYSMQGWYNPSDDIYVRAHRHRNMEINVRHIKNMLKQFHQNTQGLDGSNCDLMLPSTVYFACEPYYTEQDMQFIGLKLDDTHSISPFEVKVLSFPEVHRLVLTAIGVHRLSNSKSSINGLHITTAAMLIRQSDWAKKIWVRNNSKRADETRHDDEHSSLSDSELHENQGKKEKSEYNKYERRLLLGVIDASKINTTFKDVHVSQETIEALETLTSLYFIRPDAFKYGVLASGKIPGVLLYGPPGTGKTLLAKALAKESGAKVLEISAGEINDKYVGEGEKNVKAMFSLARKLSPCVVFIDEADSLLHTRSGDRGNGRREVINQFLKEWDGMNDSSVFIMASTNRPFDLDDAVIRRLPRRLLVDLPQESDREKILQIHLKNELLDTNVNLKQLAADTPLYSGSDLKNLCVAAALACVKEENTAAVPLDKNYSERKTDFSQLSYEAHTTNTKNKRNQEEILRIVSGGAIEDLLKDGSHISASKIEELERERHMLLQNNMHDLVRALWPERQLPAQLVSNLQADTSRKPDEDSLKEEKKISFATESSFLLPKRRVLSKRHFDKALKEISASVSGDMGSLRQMKKFDEQYGDRKGRKKRDNIGFGGFDQGTEEDRARVRGK